VIVRQLLPMLRTPNILGEPNTLTYGNIDIRYHYISDMVAQKEVVLKHISTSRMVAYPLTKPIARDVFQAHVRSLGLRRM